MLRPRQRAAHLDRIQIGAKTYRVTYRAGWIHFRRLRSRGRAEALQLADVYRIAAEQRLFAFVPH